MNDNVSTSEAKTIVIVGMNGVGKTKFGKKLASKLHMKAIDSDSAFRKIHSDEKEFIQKNGWEAFRNIEQEIICEWLQPGFIIITGGGAIESPAVRTALKQYTVIWMQAGKKRITRHLTEAKRPRPEFSDTDLKEHVKHLLEKRDPLYKEVATIIIQENVHFSKQVPVAMKELEKLM